MSCPTARSVTMTTFSSVIVAIHDARCGLNSRNACSRHESRASDVHTSFSLRQNVCGSRHLNSRPSWLYNLQSPWVEHTDRLSLACMLDDRLTFVGCSTDARWMFDWCSLDARLVLSSLFDWCMLDNRLTFVGCSIGVCWMFDWCSLGVR